MTLAQRTPADSPFAVLYQRQPNTIICSMGRVKTERQTLLDATRVNQHSDLGRSTDSDKTKVIVGKPNGARSQ